MEIKDLKLLSKLIKKYGIDDIQYFVELNSFFLDYMNKEGINNPREANPMYCETDTEQIFTNGETSIFCLKPNTIDFEILESDNLLSMYDRVSRNEIQEYFDMSKQLLGNRPVDVSCINFFSNTIISYYGREAAAEGLSNIESKLIQLLFEKTKVSASTNNPIIHVESDDGYAYVLGRRGGIQNRF